MNTEPVREAARVRQVITASFITSNLIYNISHILIIYQFWVSFFEQAAQVRIPGTDDFDEEEQQQQYAEDEEMEERGEEEAGHDEGEEEDIHRTFDPNITPSESSFTPDALVSSTPMVGVQAGQRSKNESSQDTPSSWEASIESPFDRLDKGLRSLGQDSIVDRSRSQNQSAFDSVYNDSNADAQFSSHSSRTPVFTAAQPGGKGKGKAQQPSLLQSVLEKNLSGAPAPSSPARKKPTSPLKVRQKTPKRANPYARSETARARWDGIVDLSKRSEGANGEDEQEEEERTFQLQDMPAFSAKGAAAPSSRYATQVGQTPVREAAARIRRDLVGRAAQAHSYPYQSGPLFSRDRSHTVDEPDSPDSIPSPKLSMYTRRLLGLESEESQSSLGSMRSGSVRGEEDMSEVSEADTTATATVGAGAGAGAANWAGEPEQPSLRGMMRQFGLNSDSYASSFAGSEGGTGSAVGPEEDSFEDSFDDDSPAPPVFASLALQGTRAGNDIDDDSDSDSDMDMMDGGEGRRGSAAGDEDDDDDAAGADAPIHPFARGFSGDMNDDSFDDSFDDGPGRGGGEEEGTLFGVVQAAQHHQQFQQHQQVGGGSRLQLLGRDLVDDTTALNERLHAGIGGVPDTPTPWVERDRSS